MSGGDPNDGPVYAQVAKRSTRPRACWPGARAQLRRTGFHEQAATRIVGRPKTACTCSADSASSSFRPRIVVAKTILLLVPIDGVIPSRHRLSSLRLARLWLRL